MRESTKQSNPSSIPNWETLEAWARSSIRDLLQRVLEEEVTEVLGRRRYERRSAVDGPPGSRNGYGRNGETGAFRPVCEPAAGLPAVGFPGPLWLFLGTRCQAGLGANERRMARERSA